MKSARIVFCLAATLIATSSFAQVAGYTFSQVNGTYTPVTGGTVISASQTEDDTMHTAINLGFAFAFNGINYTQIGASSNGWILFGNGAGSGTTYSALSGSFNNVVAGFARDLCGKSALGEQRVEISGSAPNRVCTVQWANYGRYSSGVGLAADNINFQIKLFETTNQVQIVYGTMTTTSTSTTGQAGLRGNSTADVKSRTTSTNWAATTAGTSSSTCTLSSTVFPASGLTFIFDAPATLTVSPAASPSAVLGGGTSIVTATIGVIPAGTPLGSVTVSLNASSAGGSASVPMLDDGVAPDAMAGDNIFTAMVSVAAAVPTTYTLPITATNGTLTGSASVSLSVYLLANDFPNAPVQIFAGQNGQYSNVNALAANTPGFDTTCGVGSVGGHDLFYYYIPTCSGTVTMSTCNGSSTTVAGELADSQLVAYNAAGTSILACNDDAGTGPPSVCGPSGFQSRITFPVIGGTTYLVRLAGWGSATGTYYINVTLSTAAVSTIGTGCGALAAPTLAGLLPVLGQVGTLTVAGADANATGLLFVSPPAGGPTALTPTCNLYLQQGGMVLFLVFATDGLGGWSFSATIPNDPALNCFPVDAQAFVIGVNGFAVTNGLHLVLGT